MQAIIDIGSNSVRLMLWADGKSLYKRVNTTRLGSGLALTGSLNEEAAERTARAVKEYAEEGAAKGASVHIFATAAVRDSENGEKFCRRVKALCGLDVDVVSGEEEARLGLMGALSCGDGGIVDIGGASTEICLSQGGKPVYSLSLPIGAVRLYDTCGEDREKLLTEIGAKLAFSGKIVPAGKTYAIGGTGSTLASVMLGLERYDGQKIQGMDERRADIIAGGALLLEQIMKKMSLAEVFASDRDNLEGYAALRGLK